MLDTLEPAESTEVLIGQGVLRDQEFVEAGETVGSSHLLPLGLRQGDTLAYGVEFIFKGSRFERSKGLHLGSHGLRPGAYAAS